MDHEGYAVWVFVLPLLLASLIEAAVSLVSHVVPRPRVVRSALGVLCLSLLVCALATKPWQLALGLSVAGAASGAASGAAEALLVARHADQLDRIMARWMVAGGVGDVLAPILVASSVAFGASYRVVFIVVFGLIGIQAWAKFDTREEVRANEEDDEPRVSIATLVQDSLRNRALWLWLSGAALCTLLDELVAALAALRLRNELGATDAQASASLIGYSCGVVVGALLTERLVSQVGYRRLLMASALACTVALCSATMATNLAWMSVSLALLGLTAAAHYPLLLARAYEAAPGHAAMVGAMAEVFVVLDLILPWGLGELADAHGLQWALFCLLAQPVGVFLLASRSTPKQRIEPRQFDAEP